MVLVMAFNDKARQIFQFCVKGYRKHFRGVRPFQEVNEIAPLLSNRTTILLINYFI